MKLHQAVPKTNRRLITLDAIFCSMSFLKGLNDILERPLIHVENFKGTKAWEAREDPSQNILIGAGAKLQIQNARELYIRTRKGGATVQAQQP
mmetsp:Transcript_6483/g.13413  ORF Transcript_6483/g.13413 Transcript_6483/m.13413 type:complete len:93 (+) Transcript_6483:707-985(+)